MYVEQGEEPVIILNKERLSNSLEKFYRTDTCKKQVFNPGILDIDTNYGKVPHGQSWRALKTRLREVKNNYEAKINDNYFIKCNSFHIKYLANLENVLKNKELTMEIIREAVSIKYGKIKDEDRKRLQEKIIEYVCPNRLITILLYEKVLKGAEKKLQFYA